MTLTIQRCFCHAAFSKEVATNQEESEADGAEAQAVFGLVAQRCSTGTVTVDCKLYEAIDDVTCREGTLADILKEVEEATGNE